MASAKAIRGGRSLAPIAPDAPSCIVEGGKPLNYSVTSLRCHAERHATRCDPAEFDGGDWAWEFLHRNQDYIADYRFLSICHMSG